MKFRRKLKKTGLFKRSSHHSRKKLSNRDLSIKINEVKNSKKKFRLSFIKILTWDKKKDISTIKLPLITPLSSPRIEKIKNEFMFMLKKVNNKSEIQNYQQGKHSTLLELFNLNNSLKEKITTKRSSHSDTSLTTIPRCELKLSSELINNNKILPSKILIKSESCLKKASSSTNRKLSLHWNENSLKSTSKQYQPRDAAIIEFEHQSYLSLTKSLEKSHSSPLPINKTHSSIANNHIQSAHIIDQYRYENKNEISLYSCVNEMGNNESTESISSDEENVKHSLLQYHENINKKSLRHRWSLFDIWEATMAKLPPILNCVWRKRVRRTGSREFLLEYDQTLPINNNNNPDNFVQEEQDRPINSHIGLALFALLVFPPVGILAMMLSIWSLCSQQDRHLSRKFGNAVYWISFLAICLSFLLLFTLFTYFTYQYLINQPISNYSSNTSSNNTRY